MVKYGLKKKMEAEKMLKSGTNVKEVCRLTGMPLSPVKKISAGLKRKNKNKAGRKKLLSPEMTTFLIEKIQNGYHTSSSKLAQLIHGRFKIKIHRTTLRKYLRSFGCEARKRKKKPLLSKINKKKRVAFAKKLKSWNDEDFGNIIWSDETFIRRIEPEYNRWYWKTSGQSDLNTPRVHSGGGGVMVWACFTAEGPGALVIMDENSTAESYIKVLEQGLLKTLVMIGEDWTHLEFQHDNAPSHKSKMVQKWFKKHNIQLLTAWPPQSPDLNPIENLWSLLKSKVHSYPTHPKSVHELKERIIKEWSELDPTVCHKLIASMPERIKEVLKKKGAAIKY